MQQVGFQHRQLIRDANKENMVKFCHDMIASDERFEDVIFN